MSETIDAGKVQEPPEASSLPSTEVQESAPPPGAERAGVAAGTYALMLREIRSWGFWSLGLGAIHLVTSGFLDASWGILLLLVGLASFYFREASMFVVYGVTLAWAAIGNLLGGQSGWVVFALFQLYLAVRVFLQFFRFRKAQAEYISSQASELLDGPTVPERAAGAFPWAGCALGAASVWGVVTIVILVFVLAGSAGNTLSSSFMDLLVGVVLDLGVLGFAVGLASLLAGYRNKWVAALGLAAGALVLITDLALALLG